MLKKRFIFILIFTILLSCFFIGCEEDVNRVELMENSSKLDYSTDMQIMYLVGGGEMSVPMTKSDTGYYYVTDSVQNKRMIIYIDKNSKKATPLCSKSNCLHNDVDECSAYLNISENIRIDTLFGANGNLIQYYDGYLYTVCGEYDKSGINYNTYLLRMDLDGSNREKITDYFEFSMVTRWAIHRGFLYYCTDSQLLCVPINDLKSEPEVLYEAKHYIEKDRNTFKGLYAYKNYLYLSVYEKDDKGEGDGKKTFSLDLNTEKWKDIKIGDEFANVNAFVGDKIVTTYADDNGKVYEMTNLDGSNGKLLLKQDTKDIQSFTSDGMYYYLDNKSKVKPNSNIEQVITVLDTELNEVDTFKLPDIDLIVYNFFAPQDEEFFIFECFNENNEHIIVMADKSQIGSINGDVIEYTELCKLKWAKNNSNGIYYTE